MIVPEGPHAAAPRARHIRDRPVARIVRPASRKRPAVDQLGDARAHGPPQPAGDPGFPTLTFLPDGALFAAWLERDDAPSPEEPSLSSLYAAMSKDGGQTWTENQLLVDSVSACCRPVMLSDQGHIA